MNPIEAHPNDLAMYYVSTFMQSRKYDQIVFVVSVNDVTEKFTIMLSADDENPKRVILSDLECWWPEAGAYNIDGQGVYVGRKARRNMKKSAYDHYYVQWGQRIMRSDRLLWMLAKGPNWLDRDAAVKVLKQRVMKSVAIAQEIILQRLKGKGMKDAGFTVIFRGQDAGILKDDEFTPARRGDIMSKLAEFSLVQEGIKCI